jgi:protein TonB
VGSRYLPLNATYDFPQTLPAYRLPAPYSRTPLRRRLSGLAVALGINVALILALLTLGIIPPPEAQKTLRGTVVDLLPQSESSSTNQAAKPVRQRSERRPTPKPPPIILPVKPTIAAPPVASAKPAPWLELSKAEMAASDISKFPAAGSGGAGDSEVVGTGPNGEALYAAQWAREPTNAELAGYLPKHGIQGFGLIACKTVENNRVEDCVELDQTPGSRLASAVRQAAWQFHVRPPRKGGRPLIGSWVRIRIDYINESSPGEEDR